MSIHASFSFFTCFTLSQEIRVRLDYFIEKGQYNIHKTHDKHVYKKSELAKRSFLSHLVQGSRNNTIIIKIFLLQTIKNRKT